MPSIGVATGGDGSHPPGTAQQFSDYDGVFDQPQEGSSNKRGCVEGGYNPALPPPRQRFAFDL